MLVRSVLVSWALGFVVLAAYVNSIRWTEDRARSDGVFLMFEQLDQAPPGARAERLQRLRTHFRVPFSLIGLDDLERRVGSLSPPGQPIFQHVSGREEWYYFVFTDKRGVLAAGPVNASIPPGYFPVGLFLGILMVPVLAGLFALRLEPQLSKVQQASQALASGELTARVNNPRGPSHELATSFNAMADRVERLVRSRDELVQAVSHELGSPLSRLRFHLELIGQQDEGGREGRLEAMRRELDALDDLVAELLGYVQSDHLELNRTEFDPKGSLADLAELTELEVPEERGTKIELNLEDGVRLNVDPRLFQRAIENLLRNARQYARQRIRLELRWDAENVRVLVHDDGPGIPLAMREKVIAPFYRLEAHRDRKTGGVGLGLAIVRRILDRHGGRIEITSSPLGGACVETVWPVEVGALAP